MFWGILIVVSLFTNIARIFRNVIAAQGAKERIFERSQTPMGENKLIVRTQLETFGNSDECIIDQLIDADKNSTIKFTGCGEFI